MIQVLGWTIHTERSCTTPETKRNRSTMFWLDDPASNTTRDFLVLGLAGGITVISGVCRNGELWAQCWAQFVVQPACTYGVQCKNQCSKGVMIPPHKKKRKRIEAHLMPNLKSQDRLSVAPSYIGPDSTLQQDTVCVEGGHREC